MNFFIAQTFRAFFWGSFFAAWQMIESRDQALQLKQIFIFRSKLLLQCFKLIPKDPRVFPGSNGKAMLEINNAEFAFLFIKSQLQFPAVEHSSILISQHRDQHFSL